VSADVVENSKMNVSYGCTSFINPEGEVIESLEHSKVGMFFTKIELK